MLTDEEVYALLPARLLSRIRITEDSDCWIWTGAVNQSNRADYGQMSLDGRTIRVHRYTCCLARGELADNLVVDHLCRTPLCVRPSRLEPVTHRTNVLRGIAPNAQATRTNRCGRGHEYTPETTYIKSNGARDCKTCRNIRNRGYWAKSQQRKRASLGGG